MSDPDPLQPIHAHYRAAILGFVAAAIAALGVFTAGNLVLAGAALMFGCLGLGSVLAARHAGETLRKG
jgi:hypothetical protein